jgi:nanoRNase/pAp phosphatase (c-di-AMP/oligoRNAs hydrolase)
MATSELERQQENGRSGSDAPPTHSAPPPISSPGSLSEEVSVPKVPKAPLARPKGRRTEELLEALREIQGERLLIVIQGTPDPDAIASAWALRYLASFYEIGSRILYFHPVSHPENRALLKTLEIEALQYDESMDLKDFVGYAIVDHQDTSFPIHDVLPEDTPLLIHVDHHRVLGSSEGRFTDIRESAGSTSAIFAEYLKECPEAVALSAGDPQGSRLATALLHGIRTDTDNFFLARDIDYRAAGYLSHFADRDLLRIISTQLISAKAMDILQRSLEKKEIRGNFLFSGVGFVRSEDRDGIAQAADYLLRREGVDTVVAFGIVDERVIDGSLRTRSQSLDPDIFLKDILGVDSAGKHYGGGRQDKGGFQIPIGIFKNAADKKLLWSIVVQTMRNLFYTKLGVSQGSESDIV